MSNATKTITVDDIINIGAEPAVLHSADGVTVSVDRRCFIIVTAHGHTIRDGGALDGLSVVARKATDWCGARGAAFIAALVSGDVRGQRLAWRQIGA